MTDYFRVKIAWLVALVAGFLGGLHPLVYTLLGLMLFDIVSGLILAGSKGATSSDASWEGMRKKAMMLIMVGAAHTFNAGHSLGFDAGTAVAGFFCTTEFISITENAGRLGLPLPRILIAAIAKLRNELGDQTPSTLYNAKGDRIDPQPPAVRVTGEVKITQENT